MMRWILLAVLAVQSMVAAQGNVGKIVFYSSRAGSGDIFSMNPDGSSVTNLSNTASVQENSPRLSWDGSKIVYSRTDALWTMNANGTSQTQLLNGGAPQSPDYHPSGTPIIFSRPFSSDYDICKVNADGSGFSQVLSNQFGDYYPRWSPDGSKFVFYTFFGGSFTPEVCVANADGSGQTRLTVTASGNSQNASWSPDGGQIVFRSSRDGNNEIYVMNADGTNQTRLTNNSASDDVPVFSPDGAKIAFVSNRDGNNEIYVMNADGTNQTRITNNAADDNNPSWQQTIAAGAPSVSINDVTLTEGNTGSTNAAFTVSLSSASASTITVTARTYDGTARAGQDYTAVNTTLTFAPGVTTQTLNVPILGDVSDELDETFSVRLIAIGASISDQTGVGTITDDDLAPTLTINDVSLNEGNSGTTNAVFTVSLSAASGQTVSVQYATATGLTNPATPGSDYTTTSGTLTIPAGQPSGTITVPVLTDQLLEADETFFVNLSNATNGTITDAQALGTIVNDDPFPGLSINNVTVTEGSAASFTVTLSTAGTQDVTLDYATADGTATAGSDYTNTTGTLTIPAGQLTGTISVPTINDTTPENNETFVVNLTNVNNAVVTDSQGQATLTSDDIPEVFVSDVSIREGNAGQRSLFFTVALSEPSPFTVSVSYATAPGTAMAGSDYVTTSGTLVYTPGLLSRSVTVLTNAETVSEIDETFFLNISGTVNGTPVIAQGRATLVNDDALPTATISDITVTEGNTGTTNATFTVALSAVSGQPVSIRYATANGTATAGSDYTNTTGTLTIPAGQSSGTITVPVRGEYDFEADETFVLNLDTPNAVTLSDTQAQATIVNDDSVATFVINDVTITEGNSGTTDAVFTVTLSNPLSNAVTVRYATSSSTARATSDFTTKSGTLTFASGETTKTIAVPIVGETIFEADEVFFVNLTNPVGATVADAQGKGTITNDDTAPTLSIDDLSQLEGNTSATVFTFTVTLSTPSGVNTTVSYATANGTAVSPNDYSLKTGTLTIAAGRTTGTVSISVKGDTLVESEETFAVNLSNPVNATIADGQGQGRILNDD
jgi:large repetitive protein